jgi:hypothetical protein
MWKEAVVAYFKVLSRHLPEGTGEHHERISVRTGDHWADIWIRDMQNTKQECQPLKAAISPHIHTALDPRAAVRDALSPSAACARWAGRTEEWLLAATSADNYPCYLQFLRIIKSSAFRDSEIKIKISYCFQLLWGCVYHQTNTYALREDFSYWAATASKRTAQEILQTAAVVYWNLIVANR